MRLIAVRISGFRGIERADIKFGFHTAFFGPNGSGKSAIIDALSLVFGRTSLVRDLTEHDFFGSCPAASTRIRIVATLGGFLPNDPGHHSDWFRDGRAVPKWWNPVTAELEPEPSDGAQELCASLGFCARFDVEELLVEQVRYFHDDDDDNTDPFQSDGLQQVSNRLLGEIGYFVLPVRRTWEGTTSFVSDLFRKTVATVGGIPATSILRERDRLRDPNPPLETEESIRPLVERINAQITQLFPQAPEFQLRLTATDSESLLRALVPHYALGAISLPVGRHGTGLLSLQTFILLLEIGRVRRQKGLSFILAMEEPELHVSPGLQRRLIAQAVALASQTICTTHAPRMASFYPATAVQILEKREGYVASTPLLREALSSSATNAVRRLYNDDRGRLVEALMHHRVLVPEGRSEYEWFRLLSDAVETGDVAIEAEDSVVAPFGAVVGVVPTSDSAVSDTYRRLRELRSGVVVLVDGDNAGNNYVTALLACTPAPETILQWPNGWEIEDLVGWMLKADDQAASILQERLNLTDTYGIDEVIARFKVKEGAGRFKADYLAYAEVASYIGGSPPCRRRANELMEAVTRACLGTHGDCAHLSVDLDASTDSTRILRFVA